jgi:hypothetical protein
MIKCSYSLYLQVTSANKELLKGQAPVAHACNRSYSGGRDQEDHGSKPAQEIVPQDPISKKPNTKKAGGMAQDVGLSSSPGTAKEKKKY